MSQVTLSRFGIKGAFKISQVTAKGNHTVIIIAAHIVSISDEMVEVPRVDHSTPWVGEPGFRICTVNPTTSATFEFYGMSADEAGRILLA
jgi:hypothetical protein